MFSEQNAQALNGDNDQANRAIEDSSLLENKTHQDWGIENTRDDNSQTESLGLEKMDTSSEKKEHLLVNGTIPMNGDMEETKDDSEELGLEATKKDSEDLEEDLDVVNVMEETNDDDSDMEVDVGGPRSRFNVGFGKFLYSIMHCI